MQPEKDLVRRMEKSAGKYVLGINSGSKNKSLEKYRGVRVGGKKYTRFSQ